MSCLYCSEESCRCCEKVYKRSLELLDAEKMAYGVIVEGPPNTGKTTTILSQLPSSCLARFVTVVHLDQLIPGTRICRVAPSVDEKALSSALDTINKLNRVPLFEGSIDPEMSARLASVFNLERIRWDSPHDWPVVAETLYLMVESRVLALKSTHNCTVFG